MIFFFSENAFHFSWFVCWIILNCILDIINVKSWRLWILLFPTDEQCFLYFSRSFSWLGLNCINSVVYTLFGSFALSWIALSLFFICVVKGSVRETDIRSAGPLALVGFSHSLQYLQFASFPFPVPCVRKTVGFSVSALTTVHAAWTVLSPRLSTTDGHFLIELPFSSSPWQRELPLGLSVHSPVLSGSCFFVMSKLCSCFL